MTRLQTYGAATGLAAALILVSLCLRGTEYKDWASAVIYVLFGLLIAPLLNFRRRQA